MGAASSGNRTMWKFPDKPAQPRGWGGQSLSFSRPPSGTQTQGACANGRGTPTRHMSCLTDRCCHSRRPFTGAWAAPLFQNTLNAGRQGWSRGECRGMPLCDRRQAVAAGGALRRTFCQEGLPFIDATVLRCVARSATKGDP